MTEHVVGLELQIISRGRMTDPVADKRKADKENGRLQAQVFAAEALLTAVKIMRTSVDETQQLKAAKLIMERAWGIPKSAVEEEDNNRAHSILEVLAAMSTALSQPAIPHEPQPVLVQDKGQVMNEISDLLVQDD